MRIIAYDELDESFYEYEEMEEIEVVKQILNEVKNNGDEAVKQYSDKFDKIKLKNLEVSKDEIPKFPQF